MKRNLLTIALFLFALLVFTFAELSARKNDWAHYGMALTIGNVLCVCALLESQNGEIRLIRKRLDRLDDLISHERSLTHQKSTVDEILENR